MRRGHFSLAYLLALFVGPFAASPGLAATVPHVGLLTYWDCSPGTVQAEFGPFLKGLKELGYRKGETFALECQAAGKSYDRLAEAARNLVQLPVDVIVTTSQPAAHAAHQATGCNSDRIYR